jgi:hypothetical protein
VQGSSDAVLQASQEAVLIRSLVVHHLRIFADARAQC